MVWGEVRSVVTEPRVFIALALPLPCIHLS